MAGCALKPETLNIHFRRRIKTMNVRRKLGTVLLLLALVGGVQTMVSAQSVKARPNRIVGVFDAQITNSDCSTGTPLFSFRGLHKYELGGTAQVVPGTNPALLSAHMGIWRHVQGNNYQLAFKMFRFDAAGNNIGWNVVKFNVAINEDATAEAGSGQSEVFDANGNLLVTTCPTFTGTRFVGE
jgi:hypothetical protein